MKGKKILTLGIGVGLFLASCGPGRPFSAKYTSPNQVVITYQGKQYTLNRYGISASVPFGYRFEDDGDLDLTINGKLYEVESPYDREKKREKKKVPKKARSKTVKKKAAAQKK
ncbi:MAG: hypothetical protein WGN25_11695 [Candidatus Electrothrix sp. GW3-4]|uniref:hypothetical protein n=1 Tax=Candidatus Electrothrix sp. GW3-4 TaxID=3126740 RepID=UPI0030D5E4F5